MTKHTTFTITPELVTKLHSVLDEGLVNGVGAPEPGRMCVEAAVCYAMGLPHGDKPTCVAPALRRLKIRLNDSRWSSNKARAEGMRRLAIAQLGSAGMDERKFARRCADLAIRTCVPSVLRAAAKIQKDEKHRAALLNAADRCERDGGAENAREARHVARAAAAAAYAAAAADAYAAAAADAYAAAAIAYAAADAADAAAAAYAYAAAADTAAAYAAYAAYAASAYTASAYAAYAASRDKSLAAFAEGVVQILIDMKSPGCEWLDFVRAA